VESLGGTVPPSSRPWGGCLKSPGQVRGSFRRRWHPSCTARCTRDALCSDASWAFRYGGELKVDMAEAI
jgi:hypothetical protein